MDEIKENTDPELEVDLTSDMYFTYVDDNYTKIKSIPNGSVFDKTNKKISIDKQTKIKDEIENLPEDKKSFNLLTKIVNTIHPELQMKNEVASDYPDLGYAVPFLDTAVWIESCTKTYPNGEIIHKFYEKPTKAPIVIHKDSDVNERAKDYTYTGNYKNS